MIEVCSFLFAKGGLLLNGTGRKCISEMGDLTRILSDIEKSDQNAANQLLPLVYDDLRKLATQKVAHEKPGQTLQATALVHEARPPVIFAKNRLPGFVLHGQRHRIIWSWFGRHQFRRLDKTCS